MALFTQIKKNQMKKWTHLFPVFVLSLCANLIMPGKITSQIVAPNSHKPKNEQGADYLQALLRFEPWAESVWKDYPGIPNSGYFGDGASEGNGGIRGSCSVALSYAVLIRAFPDAPERQKRLKRVEAALRYAAETHQSGPEKIVTVDGKKWGVFPGIAKFNPHSWQSPMWAAYMGFAAALVEKDLDPKVVESCKRVVAAEADIMATIPPSTGYRSDTKSEENAWDTSIPTLAAAWMPDDSRARKWIETAKLYMANTYTVPSDSLGPMKKWIKTQTLFPSYTLENHGFFHPSYEISGGQSLGDSYLMARIINPELEKELRPFLEFNMMPVWDVVKRILLETGDLIFPSGMDWSLHQFEDANYLAWMAAHFKMPEAQWAEIRVARQILYRQKINEDGRFVGESCRSGGRRGSTDGFYVEAVQSSVVALAYLHNEMAGFPNAKGSSPKNHITHYSDIGLIIQRSQNAVTTISYGLRTMALVNPVQGTTAAQQFLVSPNTASFIGTDGKTILKDFKTTPTGFRAELELNGIKNRRRSSVVIESTPEAVVFIEIPSDTLNHSQDEWMLTAIENHPLTGGKRTVIWKSDSAVIKNRSGAVIPSISTGWINIDNTIGLVALTKGGFIYRAASDYNRVGAAEDSITFRPEKKDKPRAVIVLPGKNATVTEAVQKSAKWTETDKEGKLSFDIPGKKRTTVRVSFTKQNYNN
jgi:hypothetical protein